MSNRSFLSTNQIKILELAKDEDISRMRLATIAEKSGMGAVSKQLVKYHLSKLKEWAFLDEHDKIIINNYEKLKAELPFFSKCKHQFFENGRLKESYYDETFNSVNKNIIMKNLTVICALCGERRYLHADGRVEILNKE